MKDGLKRGKLVGCSGVGSMELMERSGVEWVEVGWGQEGFVTLHGVRVQ